MLSVVTVSLFLFIDEEVEHEKATLTSDTVLKAMENALK